MDNFKRAKGFPESVQVSFRIEKTEDRDGLFALGEEPYLPLAKPAKISIRKTDSKGSVTITVSNAEDVVRVVRSLLELSFVWKKCGKDSPIQVLPNKFNEMLEKLQEEHRQEDEVVEEAKSHDYENYLRDVLLARSFTESSNLSLFLLADILFRLLLRKMWLAPQLPLELHEKLREIEESKTRMILSPLLSSKLGDIDNLRSSILSLQNTQGTSQPSTSFKMCTNPFEDDFSQDLADSTRDSAIPKNPFELSDIKPSIKTSERSPVIGSPPKGINIQTSERVTDQCHWPEQMALKAFPSEGEINANVSKSNTNQPRKSSIDRDDFGQQFEMDSIPMCRSGELQANQLVTRHQEDEIRMVDSGGDLPPNKLEMKPQNDEIPMVDSSGELPAGKFAIAPRPQDDGIPMVDSSGEFPADKLAIPPGPQDHEIQMVKSVESPQNKPAPEEIADPGICVKLQPGEDSFIHSSEEDGFGASNEELDPFSSEIQVVQSSDDINKKGVILECPKPKEKDSGKLVLKGLGKMGNSSDNSFES